MGFLLGRVQDSVGSDIHENSQEHEHRLQMAFEGARERLQIAADLRKRIRGSQFVFLHEPNYFCIPIM